MQERERGKAAAEPTRLYGESGSMSEALQLELNDRQREILLRGLRFVRSSRMMEFRELPDTEETERNDELGQIRQLCDLLDRKTRKGEPAAV